MVKSNRHIRLKNKIVKWMQERPIMNTTEILDKYNTETAWGCTMNELVNVLAKSKEFVNTGTTRKQGLQGSYDIKEWGLKEWHSSKEEDSRST